MRKVISALSIAIVTVGPVLVAPSAHAATTVRAKQLKTTAAFTMPTPGLRSVQALTLGTGPWTVIAKAFAVDLSGGGDIVRCQIFDVTHKEALDGAAAAVRQDYPGSVITNIAKLVVPAGATVAIQQRCGHDGTSGNPAYLDPGATLLAFKARTAAGNRLARTTAQTPLTLSSRTVATLGLSVGTWLVGYKATAVSFDANGSARALCIVEDSHALRYVSGRTGSTAVANLAGFLTVTVTASRTIAMTCQNSGGATYLDPGAVLWGRQVGSAFAGQTCGTVTGATASQDMIMDGRYTRNDPYCPVGPGAAASQVGGAAVTPGTWIVLGAEGSLNSMSGDVPGDWFRCSARDVTHNKVLDAGATAWVDGTNGEAETTYAGLLKTTTAATVEFRCGHDNGTLTGSSSSGASYLLLRP